MSVISYQTTGGVTSTTNITNGILHTQNIINLGGNGGACSGAPTYCQDGYSLYVPCLKDITRGQRVCFRSYVADKSNQDTLDLDRLCGMTLQLSGAFGCTYGSYTYPDDIVSLQGEELSEVKCKEFIGETVRLDVGYLEYDKNKVFEHDEVNVGDFNVCVSGFYGDFYKGETPNLSAYDSTTHIFLGWTSSDRMSEMCDNFSVNDLIITSENEWTWDEPLDHNITIYAIYRKRKTYRVKVSFDNRHSYFMVTYQGKKKMLSDKVRDYVDVLEGYHFMVKCVPLTTRDKEGNSYSYNFYKWSDGYSRQTREYLASDELFINNEMLLLAVCSDEKVESGKTLNISTHDVEPTEDLFENDKPIENILGYNAMKYMVDDVVTECTGIQVYDPENDGLKSYVKLDETDYLTFDSGLEGGKVRIVLNIDTTNLPFEEDVESDSESESESESDSDLEVDPIIDTLDDLESESEPEQNEDEDEIKEPEPIGVIIIKNGDYMTTVGLTSKDETEIVVDIDDCDGGEFEISTTVEELRIGKICVYERITTNKGLIELCLSPEDTLKLYRGVLNMSGAICVDDNWSGLDTVQIGVVNKLTPITITQM